ncbi:MAG: glycosyltransferase family 4 protein [Methylococcaceae bacterium]
MKRLLFVLDDLSKQGYDTYCISVNDSQLTTSSQNYNVRLFGADRSATRFMGMAIKTAWHSNYLLVGHVGQGPVALILRSLGMVKRYGIILHGIEAWERLPYLKRWALKKADNVVATTHYTADLCAQKNQLRKNQTTVIPLCITDDQPQPSDLKLNGKFKILCVGRQAKSEYGKGYHTLLQAMVSLNRDCPKAHLNLVGSGDDQERLIDMARELGVEQCVTFLGTLSNADLQAAYKDCDVFAMPSKKEGFGIVFLEAMRWGKPCIGGNHGGTPEVVEEGKNGYLIEFEETEFLAKKILELACDPKLRTDYGKHSLTLIASKFNAKSFNQKFKAVLQQDNNIFTESDE